MSDTDRSKLGDSDARRNGRAGSLGASSRDPAQRFPAASHATSGGRRLVLWLGDDPPALLRAACWNHGLDVAGISREELARMAPRARVLVLEVPPDDPEFAFWGSEIISDALAHGLHVALMLPDRESDLPHMEDREAVDKFFVAVKALRRDPERARALYSDWGRVARWAREHAPGPGASADLAIDGHVPEEPEAELLLRRAFHDLHSMSLDALSVGESGANVWLVHPGDRDRTLRTLPFIVKIHDRGKVRAEQSSAFIVRNAIDSRFYAGLHPERCVEGDELGLVVYDVVGDAHPFRNVLPSGPELLVASLFGQTMRGFHACAEDGCRMLLPEFEYGRLKALRWSDALRESAVLARGLVPTLPDVEGLQLLLTRLPAMRFCAATVHGDLHADNLFVFANSSDVVMIDYGSVLQNAPAVADPACLEVSIAFPPLETPRSVQARRSIQEWRRTAYRYPLDCSAVPRLHGADEWLPRAIRAIRTQARTIDPHPEAYAIAVASYLVRFASFGDHASIEDRALTYELACDIVTEVDRALRDGPRTNNGVA